MINPELAGDPIAPLIPVMRAEAGSFFERRAYSKALGDRLLVEDAIIGRERTLQENDWSFGNGDYKDFPQDPAYKERPVADIPLSSHEQMWAKHIDRSLEQKQNVDDPVILMDFGAGLGISLVNVGAQEKYRSAIERGSLVLAATNLGFYPSEEADDSGYTGSAKALHAGNLRGDGGKVSAEKLDFVQANQHRVHFLDASIPELWNTAVTTATGQEVPLQNGVDVISEKMALWHSHIPDLALGVFAKLLNPGGALFVSTTKVMHPASFSHITVADGRTLQLRSDDTKYEAQRKRALTIGLAAMVNQLGMKHVASNDLGPEVFIKH